jgi:hypothetical protein
MNFLKTLVITATLIISCNHIFAHTKEDTAGTEKNWFIKGAFPVSETQSLAIWAHKKDEYGVVMVNNMGVIQWEMPFKGCVLAISKYKDHFLVFYAKKGYYHDKYGITKFIKQINAATIDIKSKQIIDDKEIYKGSKYVYADILNDPAGNFSQLLLYHWTGIFGTKGFMCITFNADGSVENKEISGSATEDKYIGSSAGKDGSFFVGRIQNWSSLVVEKFSHEGTLISKLESPLTMRKDPDYKTVMRTDPSTNNSVAITLKLVNKDLDYVCSHFLFNFDNNQIDTVNEAPLAKKTTPYHFQDYKDLTPVDILFTNDKIIVIREVRTYETSGSGSSSKTTYISRNAVVSNFDKKMKLQREIIINKGTMSYSYIDIGLSCHINKDKLYMLVGENAGMAKYDNFCYTVNLNEGNYERKKIGINRPSGTTSICTLSTIWFKNEFVMTQLHIGSIFGNISSYSSVLERIGFDAL